MALFAMTQYRHGVPFKFAGTIDKLTFEFEPELKAAVSHLVSPTTMDKHDEEP